MRNKVGIGVCLRDDSGAYILVKTEWFLLKCSIHVDEVAFFPFSAAGLINLT